MRRTEFDNGFRNVFNEFSGFEKEFIVRES
jgi:hypothetical protein